MVTMFGWFKAEAAFASRSKRPRRWASAICSGGRILSATKRSKRRSRAQKTTPIPPSPSFSRISKCEMVRPTMFSSPSCRWQAKAPAPPKPQDLSRQCGADASVCHFAILRVHYDVRVLHRCSRTGGTVVGIRTASCIAFGMTGDLNGTGLGAIRSKLAAFRAGAVVELRIPGLRGSGVPHPSYFVAYLYMHLLVLLEHLSGVVNMELVHLLGISLGRPNRA